ncbi:DUF1345 domain-containing protein [Glaciibacter superstes]|uniref:DUF1345 domain-containing protein n=1 Tax=Glaciibacter superstes TaxID=501023 RepID=UPI0003B4CF13|nr:DUF1345 domain-containing protein [Glaciibacter superstes]
MMATRYVTDTARANWSSLFAGIIGIAVAVWLAATRGDLANIEPLSFTIDIYLLMWPTFGGIYLIWTHVVYSNQGPRSLGSHARRERELQRRWWSWLAGYGGASGWTLAAAFVAVLVTVLIAQNALYRSDPLYVALGLLSVATSWALMVYSFALQYLRLESSGSDGEIEHITMDLEGDPRFSDYLTLAVLLSTMAATVSAKIRTRKAWSLVRTHVLFAFTFNSVIVAMVVSLLFGGLVR